MIPVILTVYLSDGEQAPAEVPVTPETTCRDVVDFCKVPGEGGCHLAEVWRGEERAVPLDHLMYEHLQRWGTLKQEVKFFLRHEETPAETSDQGSQPPQEKTSHWGGGGGDRSYESGVGNLQDMALRQQQQQIQAQQQTLVAKEQRLRYLKQQERRQQERRQPERRQQASVSETEKLQRLKERADSQEDKLRKIRAMRGQADYSKTVNGNLSAEMEHISSVFLEKQQELQSAVLKVDQLTQQLEELRRTKLSGTRAPSGPVSGTAALELRRLYQELQIRNKLNQDQNSRLQQHKEQLNKRNMEVSLMDRRIAELRERLYRRKAEAHQKENIPLTGINGGPCPQPAMGGSGRVAAVGPYIQVPVSGRPEGGHAMPPEPLKLQSHSTAVNHARSQSETEGLHVKKPPPGPWKVSDLDFVVDPLSSPPPEPTPGPGESVSPNDPGWPPLTKGPSSLKPPDRKELGTDATGKAGPAGSPSGPTDKFPDHPKMAPAHSKPQPPPYGSHYGAVPLSSAGSTSSLERRKDSLPQAVPPNLAWQRSPPAPGSSSSQQIQQRISVPPSPTAAAPHGERSDPLPAMAVRPFVPDRGSRPQSPRKGPPTMNSSSIYHMYLQQAAPKSGPPNNKSTVKAVYGKPLLPSGPMPSSPQSSEGVEMGPPGESIPRPLSPTKLTPVAHSPLRYPSDADLEALRRRLANAPRPLKKRSSITEPEGPSGPNIQKLLYQRFNTLAGGMESGAYRPDHHQGAVLADADNGNLPEPPFLLPAHAELPCPSPDANDNRLPPPPAGGPSPGTPLSPRGAAEDSNNNNAAPPPDTPEGPLPEGSSPQEVTAPLQAAEKRTNLKKPDSKRTGRGLRVQFNPLALLLDASLEGEFDLVQRIIYEVENPSLPNDEGITPLHNAVCAGHHHIVKFLLDFGVNVNAADSDGWTPLHCAASCNSVHLCKLLVESGAAIFATTVSDVETAASKCEEMEEGFVQCSQFLYGVQEKLGVMNKGAVYALWDYEAQSTDELSFREGDAVAILRRKDDSETEWWWGRLGDREGYVPRNLLGLYPRIKPRQRSLA